MLRFKNGVTLARMGKRGHHPLAVQSVTKQKDAGPTLTCNGWLWVFVVLLQAAYKPAEVRTPGAGASYYESVTSPLSFDSCRISVAFVQAQQVLLPSPPAGSAPPALCVVCCHQRGPFFWFRTGAVRILRLGCSLHRS
jgi:hypothetical protein